MKQEALKKLQDDLGLTFDDCRLFFASQQDNSVKKFVHVARGAFEDSGVIEFDENPVVSASDDAKGGAYVMSWIWVGND
jgi:hypothetical protein